MQEMLYIVDANSSISEYAQKLKTLIQEQGIDTEVYTSEGYNRIASLENIAFDEGAKIIFIGTNLLGYPAESNISTWKYAQFGCRIGWRGDKCVIFARDTDLAYPDYGEFRKYCIQEQLDHADVIIPPKNPTAEIVEALKERIAIKDNISVQRSQYSTLVHEFMDHYFEDFLESDDGGGESNDDKRVQLGIKNILCAAKNSALAKLTTKQAIGCHAIIHAATLSCAAIAFIPLPVADVFPITGIQVLMVVKLGKIFDNRFTKSDAQILLKTVAAPIVGRTLTKAGLALVPGIGWAINGAIAGMITEILGWTIANDFATKNLTIVN